LAGTGARVAACARGESRWLAAPAIDLSVGAGDVSECRLPAPVLLESWVSAAATAQPVSSAALKPTVMPPAANHTRQRACL
jgi:hypothetical protein